MKRVFHYSSIFLLFSILSGCSTPPNSHNYAKQAGQVAPTTMPAGVDLKNQQNYYPINHPVDTATPQPSLVPPDTDFKRYRKHSSAPASTLGANKGSKIALTRWSNSKGSPVLLLAEAAKPAWSRVGKALHSSRYQVLDQDPSMSSYYILDTSVTGKQVTEKTPIYRVYVKPQMREGSMVLLMSENNSAVKNSVTKRILGELGQHLV